jgi:hypothetical protein
MSPFGSAVLARALAGFAGAVLTLVLTACRSPSGGAQRSRALTRFAVAPSAQPSADAAPPVAARADSIPTYPCRQCHDLRRTDPIRRELKEYHTTIKLQHGSSLAWCDSCHRFEDFDSLRLASGVAVTFDEAYRVCGQCHGEKLRDWLAGNHGLQTGGWVEPALKRNCTACHSPHDPRFARLEPMPAPERPRGLTGPARRPGAPSHQTGVPTAAADEPGSHSHGP